MARSPKHITRLLAIIAGLVLLNILSSYVFKRFDLTQDKRYTLSEAAKETIAEADSPIVIDIFLKGNFPPEFRRLQQETEQLLEEFKAYNSNINYQFINPLEAEENREEIQEQMRNFGLTAAQVEVQDNGKVSTELVYPWALAYYNNKTVKIPLLKNQLGSTTEERVNNSIQNLEYAFADGFSKLTQPKRRKVAVLKGNGELDDRFVADFFSTLREYYFIAPFTLDSAAVSPQRTLDQLKGFDLVVSAAPTEPFSDTEKYILDQYTMNGGASLWLVDATENRIDTLSGNTFAFGKDLNLNDFFFKYGIRVNPNLVKDIYAAPIVLASGQERESQYNRYPWFYNPLSSSANNHPVVTNIEAVKFEYASALDTLPNGISKTVLLSTSPITQIVGLPTEINIDKEIPENLKVINEGPDPNKFKAGEVPLAVLLEGEFTSVFNNRVKPFKLTEDKTSSPPTRMVVISDGDVIRNQLDRGRPLELGFDKWTQSFYGNKEFLLNTVNYLLDDSGLINIRTKEIAVAFLDPQKTSEERSKWQILNMLLPLGLLAVFGILFQYLRKRKYRQKATGSAV
jgi:ABC-2 type transport system permease protein